MSENATVSFAGHSGALVKNSDGTWKFEGDTDIKVEHLTGTSNGTSDGDYWKLTTPDGTQYFFGLNELPGWAAGDKQTNSAWTVPVCGTVTTACSGTAATAAPMSTQAYQWNLDYVVDPHGNGEALYYAIDTNHYAEHGTGSTAYTRAGRLSEIDYGLQSSNIYGTNAAGDKVTFGYTARCETGQSGEPSGACNPASPTASYWPDVPWDLNCTSTTSCSSSQISPSFWSTNMLSTVTTDVLSGSSYTQVDQWALSHSWPATGATTTPALWMTQVQQTGGTGTGAISTPATVFSGQALENRVYVWDGLPKLNKYRINAITTDTGAKIAVNYSQPQCSQTIVASLAPQTNTHLCYPQWWTPSGQAAQLDWFNKYVVTSVVSSPVTAGTLLSATQTSDYFYTGTAAWRFNQAPGMLDSHRTWSVWAGFSSVEVRSGDPSQPAAEHTTTGREASAVITGQTTRHFLAEVAD
ncbi:MAG: type IV secretion protein Rhs, partial [Actinobacteria bacterium]|nr:type IV secretion protein Rhs [Actinomycetota bacterium]